MNDAHLHLLVNHLPIIFPIVAVIILVVGMFSKSEAVKRTAYLIFILGALASIAAISTGDGAEEVIEKIDHNAKKLIHEHEEAAELFSILSYMLGALSLLGMWASFKIKKYSNAIALATLIFALVVLFFGQRTGTTGGDIRHTEIRSDANLNAVQSQSSDHDN